MNLTKGNTDGMAYLVRQGQKEVIEEDGCGRECIMLDAIARSLGPD